jgi:DNA mismatch repair protein MutH
LGFDLICKESNPTPIINKGTSLRETLICFENFNKASGLKINTSKTRVVWWEVRGIPIKFVVHISNWTGLHPISNYLE